MRVQDATGPGVTPALIETLVSWGIADLTDVQGKALSAGVANGQSMVVSAPTSSGKTLIGEIAVFMALIERRRAVYLVSHKALADQKYLDFSSRFGERSQKPIATVGLNTGDRVEGNLDSLLTVATYEKALGLILSGQLKIKDVLVVADELQIIGEPGRGPEIETLCAVLRKVGIGQFVALTATVGNPEDLSGWMECELVVSGHRDVPLHQEIWAEGKVHQTTFGQDEGRVIGAARAPGNDPLAVVQELLDSGRGPVLFFTESRKEAFSYAAEFGKRRPRVSEGIAIAEQLDLFSEPTESSESLRSGAERRVAFHTADLSFQERQVIEAGFTASQFEVCFATTTLAAGVNFPFRSIVFPKLTFQWGDRAGSMLVKSDYRNMSGRAGRLGMHPDGYSIILPRNKFELAHAQELVAPSNDRIISRLVSLSLRKTVLTLAASRIAGSVDEVFEVLRNSLYWYQTLEKNPKQLPEIEARSRAAVEWLIQAGMLQGDGASFQATALGHAAAMTGLLPATILQFIEILRVHRVELERDFSRLTAGLIYAVCACEEFHGARQTRFLPWSTERNGESVAFWGSQVHVMPFDRTDIRLAQCAHAIVLYVSGQAERKIAYATKIPSGSVHRLAVDVAWILDGLHKIVAVPELGCSQLLGNQIAMLSRRVRWGAPPEALDVLRLAERHSVPGVGRQRAMALVAQGIATIHDLFVAGKEKLSDLLRSEHRAHALLEAASNTAGLTSERLGATHSAVARKLGIEEIVELANRENGVEYERAIERLLQVEASWVITVLDDGVRQNVPDLLLQIGNIEVLIECKTCTKSPPLIKKEEAWSVVQKAADFSPSMHRVTLGKPAFDETAKTKAIASHDITLVEHRVFLEGLLRVHSGNLEPIKFVEWLAQPGVAELERLSGTPTYKI